MKITKCVLIAFTCQAISVPILCNILAMEKLEYVVDKQVENRKNNLKVVIKQQKGPLTYLQGIVDTLTSEDNPLVEKMAFLEKFHPIPYSIEEEVTKAAFKREVQHGVNYY